MADATEARRLADELAADNEWLQENYCMYVASMSGARDALRAMADKCDSLTELFRQAHDRLLRGDDDNELLKLLEEGWKT